MSQSPSTPQIPITNMVSGKRPKDNNKNISLESQSAKNFIAWYKHMIDNDRQSLGLYLSDDSILEWFGRTIKTRKKVSAFLKYDMQCSTHDFISIKNIEKIKSRQERISGKEDNKLPNPQHSPEIVSSRIGKRRILRSNCSSPEWAEGCQPIENNQEPPTKKKMNVSEPLDADVRGQRNGMKRKFDADSLDFNNKGDGAMDRRMKRKLMPVTPPNHELGQGDCMPSTSGTDTDRSHNALNAQLPKLYVECNGYIQFMRTRNSNNRDAVKWERKCKAQISYSVDPLNPGEYIIWAIHYTDESKCRRNLLSAFEEVAKDEFKRLSIDG